MKSIRKQLFETNSSSTHSVTLVNQNTSNIDFSQLDVYVDPVDHYIHMQFGEFGWEEMEYTDALTKLQYLLNMIIETNQVSSINPNGIKTLGDFYNCDDFLLLKSIVIEHVKDCEGIVIFDDQIKANPYESEDEHHNPCINYYLTYNGYIDHQSHEGYKCLANFLDEWDITIEEFIFDTNVVLVTDNDNH